MEKFSFFFTQIATNVSLTRTPKGKKRRINKNKRKEDELRNRKEK